MNSVRVSVFSCKYVYFFWGGVCYFSKASARFLCYAVLWFWLMTCFQRWGVCVFSVSLVRGGGGRMRKRFSSANDFLPDDGADTHGQASSSRSFLSRGMSLLWCCHVTSCHVTGGEHQQSFCGRSAFDSATWGDITVVLCPCSCCQYSSSVSL